MKKLLFATLLVLTLGVVLTACGEKKILQCDNCYSEIKVSADSEMTDEWILFCETCADEITVEDPALGDIIS